MLLEHRIEMLERDLDKLEKRIAHLENISTKKVSTKEYDKEDNKKKNLEVQATLILREVGVPAHLCGYKYLRSGMILAIEDHTYLDSITTRLYPQIALIHETTHVRVERSVRKAVEKCWENGNVELLNNLFGNSISPNTGKATNLQFITVLVEELKMKSSL